MRLWLPSSAGEARGSAGEGSFSPGGCGGRLGGRLGPVPYVVVAP